MCGIIAIKSEGIKSIKLVKSLILESQIRGKHSTGVSYICKDGLKTVKDSLPAREFITKHFPTISRDLMDYGKINLIAHTRYSTSGAANVKNAQPISDDRLSIVLNGVITQSSPDTWLSDYGVQCETTNDTEIAMLKLKNGTNPLLLSKGSDDIHSSMAIAALWSNGRIQVFRNGRRPAYMIYKDYNGEQVAIVASTKQIIDRAIHGTYIIKENAYLIDPCVVYELGYKNFARKEEFTENVNNEDWQIRS